MKWLQKRFESARVGVGGNIRAMEGIRGFAVILVFVVHYISAITPWIKKKNVVGYEWLDTLHLIGNAGVDLFFVLSGYLIYGSLMKKDQPFLQFMKRRVQRIYPAFIVVFLAYIGLSLAMPTQSKIPDVDAGLYLLQNFLLLPGLFPIEPMITVAWSLSYEMFYYALIPLIIYVFALRKQSPTTRIIFFLSISVTGAVYCAFNGGPVRLIVFIAGILLYEAISLGRKAPPGLLGLLALIVGLLCTNLAIPGTVGNAIRISILFLCFFVLCWACFAAPESWLARPFTWTPMRWLGNMSYSYYLIHGLAINCMFIVLGPIVKSMDQGLLAFSMLLPIVFAFTLIPSAVLFLVIERPLSLQMKRPRPPSAEALV